MKNRARLFALAAVVLVLSWAATKVFAPSKPLDVYEGYVEGDLEQIAPIEGERLDQLDVQPGAQVKKGEALFTLATPVLAEERVDSKAKVVQAEANLKNLQEALQRPQQIAVLNAAVAAAKAALALSQADYDRQAYLVPRGAATVQARDQAKMALDRDNANLAEAQRQVEAAQIPSRRHEIAAAQAAIIQAQAELNQIDVRIARQTVHAPEDGIVQDVYFWPGEMVNAGQPVLALLPPENRKIRLYVPETELARFSLGARLAIACDNCAADLQARVIYISQQAEFTPPVIFSLDERGKLVFRIDARPDDNNLKLPLGQPVTARLVAPEARR